MRHYLSDLERQALSAKARLGDVQQLLMAPNDKKHVIPEYFPIVQHCPGQHPLLVATISRKNLMEVFGHLTLPSDTVVDFLDLGNFQQNPREQLVNRTPLHVDVSTAVQHVFLILKV